MSFSSGTMMHYTGWLWVNEAKGAKFDIVDTTKLADVEDFTLAQLLDKTFSD